MEEKNIKKGFNQIEYCGFKDDYGHLIEHNVGYIEVKETFAELLHEVGFLACCVRSGETLNDKEEKRLNDIITRAKEKIF